LCCKLTQEERCVGKLSVWYLPTTFSVQTLHICLVSIFINIANLEIHLFDSKLCVSHKSNMHLIGSAVLQ